MKYLILIYGDQAIDPCALEFDEPGEYVDSAPLADPINTRTVRVRDDVLTATAGPLRKADEHLAGYMVVDCESPERATEIAGRFPHARRCTVEVRPIMGRCGMEM